MNKSKSGHAIALFSGGLDSTLAIILVLRQNIEVTALTFLTPFGCDIADRSGCGSDPYPVAQKFGFNVKLVHLGGKFIDIVTAPRFGYGKNMNPCIDCRILMLQEAKIYMDLIGADFIITGEVIGQRPKSQFRPSLNLIERESGLKGYLVRPLSAKLLDETIPEKNGLLNRELMERISGRSRKRQLELAKEFGLNDFPSPAGGCLLTTIGYSNRLRDLLTHADIIHPGDIELLRVGRHFRLDPQTKLIVGRDENDNEKIMKYLKTGYLSLEALNTGSPVALLIGNPSEENINRGATITARYCDLKYISQVEITCTHQDTTKCIKVRPATPDEAEKYLIK
ncbi:MAG: hypothetical protein NTV06_02770 [candidate division Zixibacteria bacterium]|nr:hypothetical protein [candidate division Zixibacteria bacterium]